MLDGLRPYPAMKDSGVPWLGKVPEHWVLRRLKREARINPSKSEAEAVLAPNADVAFLPMERVGADGHINGHEVRSASSLWTGLTYFRRGDVLVAKITPCFENGKGAYLGALQTDVGFGSTEFIVLRAMAALLPEFLYRITTLPQFRKLGADAMTGAAGQQRVPLSFIADFLAPIPPLPEQAAIVRFLDHADRHIRRFIATKRRLIELLNEQKQAIIQRAVTRGLDPKVRLKPSGIDWLGDIPAHWDKKPAKYSIREIDERSSSGTEELLSVSHITGVSPRSQKNVTMFMAASYVGHKLCRPGDLVINTMWAWMGALGVARQTGIVSSSYAVYRLRRPDAFVPEFLDYLLRTRPYISEYTCRSIGIRSSRLRLYPEQFLRILLIQPPREEQGRIVDQIAQETQEFDAAIDRAQREIELIREYRTRLISDVVTGKLDVRGVELSRLEEAEAVEPVELEEAAEDASEVEEDLVATEDGDVTAD